MFALLSRLGPAALCAALALPAAAQTDTASTHAATPLVTGQIKRPGLDPAASAQTVFDLFIRPQPRKLFGQRHFARPTALSQHQITQIKTGLSQLIEDQRPETLRILPAQQALLRRPIAMSTALTAYDMGVTLDDQTVLVARFQDNSNMGFIQIRRGDPVTGGNLPRNFPPPRLAARAGGLFRTDGQTTAAGASAQRMLAQSAALTKAGGGIACSAYPLNDRLLITAAHCACARDQSWMATLAPALWDSDGHARVKPLQWDILGGQARCEAHCATGRCDPGFYDRPDLALVRLAEPLGPDILLPRLATAAQMAAAQEIYWVGHGITGIAMSNAVLTDRRGAPQQILSADCTDAVALPSPCNAGTEAYFVSPDLARGPCKADSGGPGFIVLSDGSLALAALVSRAAQNAAGKTGCGLDGIGTLLSAPEALAFLAGHLTPEQYGSPDLTALLGPPVTQ